MAKIVLLEDESDLLQETAAFLQSCGHVVTAVSSCAEFTAVMMKADIALIDIMLPDGNGFDMAAALRRVKPRAGIIILTAKNATEDKLRGLYGGADHYLTKPIKLLELTAIIDSLGRRVGSSEWLLLAESRRLQSPEGLESELTASEMVIFQLLLNNPGQVISRRQIVEALGHSWVDYDLRRLDTLVSRLRRRWREKYELELPLKTEHRDGYSFCAVLSEV